MNETLDVIKGLKSTHVFLEKEIARSDLETILVSSVQAANASARQSYSIIVIDEKQALKELFYGGNKALVYCVDYTRLVDTAKHLGHSYEPRGIGYFVAGVTDTALAVQTAVIAAKSLGIDSLITNVVHRKTGQVYKLLELPEKFCFPIVALCLGYSAENPAFKKGRLRNSGVVHYGKYRRLSKEELDSLVALYDDENEHLGLLPKEKWESLGFSHYLDWFYRQWSTRAHDNDQLRESIAKTEFF
jgi:nitroreductase